MVFSFPKKALKGAWCFPCFVFFGKAGWFTVLADASKTKKNHKNWDFFKKKVFWGASKVPETFQFHFGAKSVWLPSRFFRQKTPQSWITNPLTPGKPQVFWGEILPNGQALGYGGFVTNWQRQKKKTTEIWGLPFLYSSFHILFVCFREITSFGKGSIHGIFVEATRFGFWSSKLLEDQPVLHTPLMRRSKCRDVLRLAQIFAVANPRNMSLNCART